MDHLLFAAFADREDAERAVHELEAHGFDPQDLSIITKETETFPAAGPASRTASGAIGGAATGGVIGGLAGILTGTGVFPALAGFLIGGPVAAALGLTGIAAAGVSGAVTGAAVGGLLGALMGLGLSREDAEYYTQVIEKEGILLIVPFEHGTKAEARAVLDANHAQKIQEVDMAMV